MQNEYFINTKSKSVFVGIGVVVVFLLIPLLLHSCSSSSPAPVQKEYVTSDTSSERNTTVQDVPTQKSLSLQSSLYQDGETLVGFVKSSDKDTLNTYKKSLKPYAEILRSTDEGFIFLSEESGDFPIIYQILKKQQPSFRRGWD
ncbi:MAG: hypothetical protein LBD75_01040 [Candidatus Peribacteria bacterium]|jgi:hypothetical protein|nr:hypothetical protein [Candidatus Peribacteria bacterium]